MSFWFGKLTFFVVQTYYLVRSRFYLENDGGPLGWSRRSILPHHEHGGFLTVQTIAEAVLLLFFIPFHYTQQWLPIKHHHPYFKDQEVMCEEMKWLAHGLPISKHQNQGTPVYWMLNDTKNSWHFVSIWHTSSHLTFTTWWTGYYGYYSPSQKKIESQQNCHLPVVL